jgi:hypothetical protein
MNRQPPPVVFLSWFFVTAMFLQGCATRDDLTLQHDVNVPKEFRSGNYSDEHSGYDQGNSTVERYVDAYERGWTYCVERFADNINLDDPSLPPGSGWPEEAYGFSAGYADARDRIESLIRIHGKMKVSAYLQQFRPGN